MPDHSDPVPPSRVGPFFVMALGITWISQLPAVLAQRGILAGPPERFMLPATVGTFGPLIAALIAAHFDGSGARSVFASLRARFAAPWLAVALFGFVAIEVAGWAVYRALGGSAAGGWLYLPERPLHVAAMILVPIAEEPGWRGFALPRLQRRMSPLAASLVLGVVWAAWHTTMFLLAGVSPAMFAVSLANIFVGSVLFSWLFNRTAGSLAIALVAHAGAHLANPSHALPAHPAPLIVYTGAAGVAALALIAFDRDAWRRCD